MQIVFGVNHNDKDDTGGEGDDNVGDEDKQ